uniref:Uncharacterized protein n=1 Tax=Physcomitrium patens TaxID=3218 RepID=A0A7I4BPD8_PHYPA
MEKAGGWTCDRMVCFVLESVAATHEVVENSRDSAGGLLVEGVEVAV